MDFYDVMLDTHVEVVILSSPLDGPAGWDLIAPLTLREFDHWLTMTWDGWDYVIMTKLRGDYYTAGVADAALAQLADLRRKLDADRSAE